MHHETPHTIDDHDRDHQKEAAAALEELHAAGAAMGVEHAAEAAMGVEAAALEAEEAVGLDCHTPPSMTKCVKPLRHLLTGCTKSCKWSVLIGRAGTKSD